MKTSKQRRWRSLTAAALALGVGVTVSACADDTSSGNGSKASSADKDRYQATLEKLYEGTYTEPSAPVVTAPKDKSVWLVSVGLGIEYSARGTAAAKEVGERLGWDVHVFDAKFDPNQMLTGVQQAIVAKADGIVLSAIDCATVKNGIQQATDAGIPVIGIESKDCDPGLLTHVVTYVGHQSFPDATLAFGEAQAAWVIAKTEGAAKTVINTATDTETGRLEGEGIRKAFEDCPTCSVVDDATWVGTDLGPALQEKIQQTLIKHPDANSFIPALDAPMTQSGGANAIQATGRGDKLVVGGGEGSSAGIEQIRNGVGMQMCVGQSVEWETYSAFDALVRLYLDRDPAETDTGNGLQVCDKDHNLPPEGEAFTPPIDFAAAYDGLWGLS